ncbi:hypothetical protein CK203_019606 [Vitis vinifera]|uniref:Uncharacterized protein n=1 Tax=Vitis vinifera TaxID=29760 RepID=A0A438JQR8_VITVI|nr:hypothetical protein CK203_019606 [Vitis vinifera]
MDFLSYVAEVSRGWDEPNAREVGRMKSQPNAKVGSLVEECPTIPIVREMFGDQANVIGQFKPNNNASYGNTYNSNWRNHPNFSWKPKPPQYTQPAQAPQQASNLEQAIVNLSKCGEYIEQKDGWMQNDLSQKIDNVQYAISRLTNLNTVQEKGKFPSQPHQNPKGIHEVEAQEGESSKDLCTVKRGFNVNKKAFLIEQVSAIIQCKSPVKYKDPGCPTISVSIGGTCVEKALLDLEQISEDSKRDDQDVLVQVDKFYYPVDFVVLDTDRNGVMQLTFGNMTLELNIFHLCKKHIHPEEEEGPEEVCMIDTLVEEHCDQRMQEDLIESFGDLDEGLPEPSDLLATCSLEEEEKKFYPYSMRRRRKEL